MRNCNFDEDLILIIQALYANSNSAVFLNKFIKGAHSRLFLKNIKQETLIDFNTTTSIGGRPICNLRLADDIDFIGGSENKLQDLTTRVEEAVRKGKS